MNSCRYLYFCFAMYFILAYNRPGHDKYVSVLVVLLIMLFCLPFSDKIAHCDMKEPFTNLIALSKFTKFNCVNMLLLHSGTDLRTEKASKFYHNSD